MSHLWKVIENHTIPCEWNCTFIRKWQQCVPYILKFQIKSIVANFEALKSQKADLTKLEMAEKISSYHWTVYISSLMIFIQVWQEQFINSILLIWVPYHKKIYLKNPFARYLRFYDMHYFKISQHGTKSWSRPWRQLSSPCWSWCH